jgi:hypothetical protein
VRYGPPDEACTLGEVGIPGGGVRGRVRGRGRLSVGVRLRVRVRVRVRVRG